MDASPNTTMALPTDSKVGDDRHVIQLSSGSNPVIPVAENYAFLHKAKWMRCRP